MDTTSLLYVFIVLAVVLTVWVIRLEIKMSRLLAGQDGKSLETSIVTLIGKVGKLEGASIDAHAKIAALRAHLRKSIQRVETIRFNPFKGTGSGGNQSFVTSFSDEDGNGVVISGLYARDGVSVYAKPISKFASEYNLSEEEKEIIEKLKQRS
ncbi:MAG: DUF4446 family protein [Candidatus Parcubacteria bacterium]|nr:DUF4446 family protein [Candidatus Parcubacteria bacterium]